MADKNYRIKIATQGAKKSGRAIGGVDKRLKGLAKSAGLAAAAFFGARALLSGFKEAVRLAGIQEQAEKRLAVALGGTSQALLKQASALQQVTTFGDEAIIGVQASLAAFIKNEDQIKLATEATLDMAVAMGMDLKAAGDLVAKTLGSSTNAMSRYGIEVEGAVGSTERLESLTNNVAKLFGGQAKAQAETMAGSLEQMGNAIGDAAEAFGEVLSPVVITFAKGIKFAAEAVGGFIDIFKEFGKEVEIVKMMTDSEAQLETFKESLETMTFEELVKLGEELSKDLPEGSIYSVLPAHLQLIADKSLAVFEQLTETSPLKPIIDDGEEALDILDDIAFTEGELAFQRQEAKAAELAIEKKLRKEKEEALIQDLKQAALVQGSAEDAMKAVVRAEAMEGAAGLIASILKSVPFPANLILAAGAGAATSKLIDKGLASFAQGGDFITSGPQMIMVGDNPSGRERVTVTPSERGSGGSSITVNISGGVVQEDYVRNELIPALNKATGTGTRLNA